MMTSTKRFSGHFIAVFCVWMQITALSSCLPPPSLQTSLSLTCGYCLIKQKEKRKITMRLQEEIKWKRKSNLSSYFSSFLYALGSSVVFLSLDTWVCQREKKQQSTWQSIIAPLQNVPSVGQTKRTQAYWAMHAHTQIHTQSLVHEENQNVECPRANTQHRRLQPPVNVLYEQESEKGGVHHNCGQNIVCGIQW